MHIHQRGVGILFLQLFILCGCAHHDYSAGRMSQMTAALKQVYQLCSTPQGHNPFNTVEKQADCLTSRERPIWFSYDPDTTDLYDDYARRRAAIAHMFDLKRMSQPELLAELNMALTTFNDELTERRQKFVASEASRDANLSNAASDVGQLFGAVLIGAAEVAGAAATQAPAQPTGIVSTSTTCQALISTVQCNSLTW